MTLLYKMAKRPLSAWQKLVKREMKANKGKSFATILKIAKKKYKKSKT